SPFEFVSGSSMCFFSLVTPTCNMHSGPFTTPHTLAYISRTNTCHTQHPPLHLTLYATSHTLTHTHTQQTHTYSHTHRERHTLTHSHTYTKKRKDLDVFV